MRGGELRSFYSAFSSSDPTKFLFFFALSSFTCSQGAWTELRGLLPADSSTIAGEKEMCHLVMYAEVFFLFLAFETNSFVFSFSMFLYLSEVG